MSTLQRVRERRAGPLPASRAARRMSAYVYGNVLVLAAVVGVGSEAIEDGRAVLLVLGTTVSTYLAHVYAEAIAHSMTATDGPHRDFTHELRDAVPIVSSGTVPLIALILGYLEILPSEWAQAIAGGVIAVRIAWIGIWMERLHGHRPSFRMVLLGLASAAICAVIVLIKVVFAH